MLKLIDSRGSPPEIERNSEMGNTEMLVHEPPTIDQSAESFRGFEQAFKDAQNRQTEDLKIEAMERRQALVKEMIAGKITDATWNELVEHAQKAAAHGEKEFLMLRFPSDLCTDDSRAINNPPNSTWPQTLRGEAADIYERWRTSLRPHGFDLSAQVLDFPGGKPGEVGLFLRWGSSRRI
jgi:hypothetical protein